MAHNQRGAEALLPHFTQVFSLYGAVQILLRHGVADNIRPHAMADGKGILRGDPEAFQGDGNVQRAAANIYALLLKFDIAPAPGQGVGVGDDVNHRGAQHRHRARGVQIFETLGKCIHTPSLCSLKCSSFSQ